MKRVRRDERGAALIIALAFLALFSLFLAATLAAADGGLHISQTMKVQPVKLYSADGAIEKAIQDMRYVQALGRDDGTNCDSSVTLNGQNMYVACTPQEGSGQSELGGSSPTLGVIALSNGFANEAGYQQSGNSIVRIDGGLYSNSTLSFVNGNQCNGSDTNCQQLNLCPANEKTVTDASYFVLNIDGVDTKFVGSNSAGFVDTATRTDIGAPIRGSGIPANAKIQTVYSANWVTLDKAPTQVASNRTVTFRENFPQLQKHCSPPATAHGKLTALLGPCDRSRTVSIQFNCKDTAAPVVPDLTGADPNYPPVQTTGFVDRIAPTCNSTSSRVVELEPGRYSNVAALNALSGCDKVLWFKPGAFYFDFSGVWNVGASSNKAQTIVAGAKTFVSRPSPHPEVFNASVKNNSNVVDAGSQVFTTDDVGKYISSSYNLPFGSRIVSVSTDRTKATINKTVNSGVNNVAFMVHSQDSLCDSRTEVNHAGTQFVFANEARMSITESRTEICAAVDGNQQQIAIYGVKTAEGDLAPQSGCAVLQPYPSGACPTISTSGPKPMFIVHGTVYLPNSVFDLSLQTVSYQVVSRGIIARVIALGISPSADFKDPLIYSPNFGSVVGAPRRMLLVACENNPCASGGTPKLRAMVRIEDTEPGSPNISVGNRVVVESWTVLR
jgi:hypothetical protein